MKKILFILILFLLAGCSAGNDTNEAITKIDMPDFVNKTYDDVLCWAGEYDLNLDHIHFVTEYSDDIEKNTVLEQDPTEGEINKDSVVVIKLAKPFSDKFVTNRYDLVEYGIDYEKVFAYTETIEDENEVNYFFSHYPSVTYQDVENIVQDDRVVAISNKDVHLVYPSNPKLLKSYELNNEFMSTYIYEDDNYSDPLFSLNPCSFPNPIEIERGDIEIVEGRFLTSEDIKNSKNVVVISKNLAETNNLNIGDHISITENNHNYNFDGIEYEYEDLDLEIVGLFKSNYVQFSSENHWSTITPYELAENRMYAPIKTFADYKLIGQQAIYDALSDVHNDEYYSNKENRPNSCSLEDTQFTALIMLKKEINPYDFIESKELPEFQKFEIKHVENDGTFQTWYE